MARTRTASAAPAKTPAAAKPHRTTRRAAQTGSGVSTVADFNAAEHHHEIAVAAYLFWEQRGGAPGSPEEDWSRAEAEVRARYS